MKLAHFSHRFPPALGGSEFYFEQLSLFHHRLGDEVTVFTSSAVSLTSMWQTPATPESTKDYDERSPLKIQRFKPLVFPGRRLLFKLLSMIPIRRLQVLFQPSSPFCPKMWREACQPPEKYDAVHALAFPYSFPIYAAYRLARKQSIPFLITPFLHTGDHAQPENRIWRWYSRPHLRWLLQQADAVFVQTEGEFDAALRLGVPIQALVKQGLGLDLTHYHGGCRATARRRWQIDDEEMVIGHLANNSREKGTLDLLQVSQQLSDAGIKHRLLLAGPEMPSVTEYLKANPLPAHVTRLQVLAEQEKNDFFEAIDLFCLPSVVDSFGLVLLESWAHGKPVVVYQAGGPAEIVRHEQDGLVARCHDLQDLQEQLQRLMTTPGLRQALGSEGRARVRKEFILAEKLLKVRETIHRLLNNTFWQQQTDFRDRSSPPQAA